MTSETRDWYLRAAGELAATSPRQVSWCHGVAGDERMLQLLETLPRPARQPSLLFAVAAWLGAPDADYEEWSRWLLDRSGELTAELPRRRVQTNEPARCAPLAVALGRIPGPVALVELGASAGLCLLPDRYGYRFAGPDGVHELGAGPPVIETEVDDADLVPPTLADIRWRRGVDLDPVDAASGEGARWLEASLPPDRPDRRARLRAALAVLRAEPPSVVAGDAVAALPELVAAAPAGLTVVVVSLGTAVYLAPGDRAELLDRVAALGARAVTFEPRAALPPIAERWAELAAEGRADASASFLLAVDGEPLASASAHGDRLVAVRPAGRPDAGAVRS